MISKLKGKICDLKPTELTLDVNDVGYQVFIPFTTYEKLTSLNSAELFIHTLHKEEQFKLFGFFTREERELFSILIGLSGIGPSMAIAILSGLEIEILIEAVNKEDPALLTKVPGIGKAKAEKLIFELKRKIKKIESLAQNQLQVQPSSRSDALDAIITLGFDEASAKKVIDDVLKTNSGITLEELIKTALKNL